MIIAAAFIVIDIISAVSMARSFPIFTLLSLVCAVVCLPGGDPLCGECPWEKDCLAHAAAREKGLVRIEGKEYVMQDGDVVLFRFNV